MPAKTPGLLQHGAALRPTEHRHFDTRFREQLGPGSQPEPFAVLSAGAAETGGHHGGDPGPGHAAGIVAAPEIVAAAGRLRAAWQRCLPQPSPEPLASALPGPSTSILRGVGSAGGMISSGVCGVAADRSVLAGRSS